MSSQAPEILLAHHLKALKLPTCLREHQKHGTGCPPAKAMLKGGATFFGRTGSRSPVER